MRAKANHKLSIREKIGYALGDGAANIAWRGVATFLFIFYTDVYGLSPASMRLLMLVARSGDGVSDVLMGIVGDRTRSKYGKFRPWILWTAIPLAISLSLLFTTPELGPTGKLAYAYFTYILFTLLYTANNIPYGALMAVMTGGFATVAGGVMGAYVKFLDQIPNIAGHLVMASIMSLRSVSLSTINEKKATRRRYRVVRLASRAVTTSS